MRKPLQKIVLVFVLVALLPVGFIAYEFGSLNKNEKIVREIYENQLDAILFSINQYSDDVINSWANRLSLAAESARKDSISSVELLMNQFNGVRYVYFSDRSSKSVVHGTSKHNEKNKVRARFDSLITMNHDVIDRLIRYNEAGFRKMELIDTIYTDLPVPVFFAMNESTSAYRLGAIAIDLPEFIENTLGPKLQGIAQEKFVISVYKTQTDSLEYSTSPERASAKLSINDESQKKSFWLLPGYYLSISLTGATIDDLVRDRMMTSGIILGVLIFVLALGIVFLYKSIRREMYLAQAKSEFVSNVSHEIRTPLSLISMYAETLEMNRVGEEKKLEYQRVIAKETARLSGIVNRILNFSQIQANKKVYQFKTLQLNDVVDSVLQSYQFHLNDKGFNVQCEKQSDLKDISGDYESITEALVNLLDNAMKYSPGKKDIRVKTGTDGKYAFIEVKDQGLGIAKKHHDEIFEQFFRAPSGDVHNTKGSGLGLTLVKKTMESHKGKIKVDSTPGKGSTFRLYFPIKTETTS
jgi:two-component system, OmpR family, phosphate regulon sensor histidine kinase PhoR